MLKDLTAISRDQLSPADRLNYDLFRHQYQMTVEGFQHRQHLIRTSTLDGVQGTEFVVDSLRFQTVKDFDDWVARLEAFPAYMDQNIALMREGMKANVLLPKIIAQRVRPQIVAARHPESGRERLLPPVSQHSRRAACRRSRATDEGGARQRPRARAAGVREAARVHGSRVPARLVRRRRLVADEQRARGLSLFRAVPHDDRSRAAGHSRARPEGSRAHPRRDGSDQEAGRLHRDARRSSSRTCEPIRSSSTRPAKSCSTAIAPLAKRIDPELIKISRKLPRTPYGVIQIPDAIAPMSPTAFASGGAPDGSRPAYFFANLYKPETRPKWEMMALTLHEAMPGHCLQISIAQELGDLPQFRRHAFFTAYVEGWGLYAESLGEDMGLYKDDPYSKFGQLTYEMWRAVRLVVDTGIHAMEWERERAIKYFMDERREDRERRHERDRSLHLGARSGAGVQDWRAEDQGAARADRSRRSARSSICATSTTSCCNPARCRSTFSRIASTNGSRLEGDDGVRYSVPRTRSNR